jgi:hypothetical protein
MSRDDLLNVNYKIMQQVTEQVVKYSPNCIIIPVSNPLDAMAQAVLKLSKFPREAGHRHGRRARLGAMRSFIAKELNVSVENIHAFVLGGHGDTMVPLPRYSTVAGIPITDLLSKEAIDRISARTARGGLEITELVGTSAWYAPGSVGRRDGRGDPARQEEDPAVLGLPAGGIRHAQPVCRRPVQAGRARAGRDHPDYADGGRGRRVQEVRQAPSRNWWTLSECRGWGLGAR